MKLIEIVNAYTVIDQIAKEDAVYTAKTSFAMLKFIKAASEDVNLYNEKRDELIRKYGKESEAGMYVIDRDDQESIQKFITEANELGDLEIEDKFVKFDESMLGELRLSIKQAAALLPFLKD